MRILILSLMLLGCEEPAQKTVSTTNQNIKVELLFEHDGCKVYRFNDGGTHYYARCPMTATVSDYKDCGEDCQYHETVQTVPLRVDPK